MVAMSTSLTFCSAYVVASADAEVLGGGVMSAVVVCPEVVTAMSAIPTTTPEPAIAPKSAARSLSSGKLPEESVNKKRVTSTACARFRMAATSAKKACVGIPELFVTPQEAAVARRG